MAVAITTDRRQRAKDALDACHLSEQEIAQFIKEKRSPFNRDYTFARSNLQHNYEKAVFSDFEFALEKSVEVNLWKRVFYSVIEKCRGDLRELEKRASVEQKGRSGGDKKNPRQFEQRKLLDQYRNFLINAIRFYLGFVQKLACEFGLDEAKEILARHQLVYSPSAGASAYSAKLRRAALQSCHRSIIFLGDLERYKEIAISKQSRDFAKAVGFYSDARELVPTNGHPFNQLGVIAAYTPDDFGLGPMYFYYRACCVRVPFEIAPGNLEQLFNKVYEGFRKESESVKSSPFLVNYMRLHAFIFLKHGTSKSGMQAYDQLESFVMKQWKNAIADLQISQIIVYQSTIANLACLPTLRLRKAKHEGEESPSHGQRRRVAEVRTLLMILRQFKVLLDVANDEVIVNSLSDDKSDQAVDGTSENGTITPILRRILPSIRIYSKWLRTHLTVLYRVWPTHAEVGELYQAYANLQNGIGETFSSSQVLEYALEEDLDLIGFLPVKNLMLDRSNIPSQKMHPNDEQMMRLSDLQKDGEHIVQHIHGGLLVNEGKCKVKPKPLKAARDVVPADFFDIQEDVAMNGNGHVGFSMQDMVDDITGDKDHSAAETEDDSDEEQIIIERKDRSGITSVMQSPLAPQLSLPAVLGEPVKASGLASSKSMTADDLVAQILNPIPRPSTTPAQSAHPPGQWSSPQSNAMQTKSKAPQQWYAAATPAPPAAPPPPPQWKTNLPSPSAAWRPFPPLDIPFDIPRPPKPPQPPHPPHPAFPDHGIFGPSGPFGEGRGFEALPGIWSSSWTGSHPLGAPPGLGNPAKTSSAYVSFGNAGFAATAGPFGSSFTAQWQPEKEQGEWEGYG